MSRYDVEDPVDYNECGIELRKWQKGVRDDYSLQGAPDRYLISATPGAGKTYALGAIFHDWYNEAWRRLIVVTNSRERREGWVGDMAAMGIQLMEDFAGNATVKDYHGCVITYDKMVNSVAELQRLCHQRDTLVAFDETHHLGEEQTWGEAAVDAFGQDQTKTIGLTGTPFRSDNNPIPFVEYEPDGAGNVVSVPDFEYDYADALADQVVRRISFETWDGNFEWVYEGEANSASFEDDLPDDEQSRRLWTALTEGEYRIDTIRDANDRLERVRQHDPDAGGLVVTVDQTHAHDVAEEMRGMGHDPVVVTSDDPGALDKIDRFRKSDDKWIVAVRMISEGVDIKRLRVGVYLSNVTTDLFLRQVIGRTIRVEEDCEDTAWFWFPRDPRIMPTLENIRDMKRHIIESRQGDISREAGKGDAGEPSSFVAIDSETTVKDRFGPLVDEVMTMSPEELSTRFGEEAAYVIEVFKRKAQGDTDEEAKQEAPKPKHVREQELRDRADTLVRKLAAQRAPDAFEGGQAGEVIREAHWKYNKRAGFKNTDNATVDQLEKKVDLLKEALNDTTK